MENWWRFEGRYDNAFSSEQHLKELRQKKWGGRVGGFNAQVNNSPQEMRPEQESDKKNYLNH